MKHFAVGLFATLAATLVSCGETAPRSQVEEARTEVDVGAPSDAAMQSMLNTYCVSCHSGARPPHGVVLDNMTGAKAAAVASVKELNAKKMPPSRATKQPSAGETASMVAWFSAH